MHFYLGCASQSVACQHPGYVRSVMSCNCPTLSVCHPKLRAFEPAARKNLATEALKKFDSYLMNVSRLGTSLFRVCGNVGMHGREESCWKLVDSGACIQFHNERLASHN